MTHDFDHDELEGMLPEGMHAAFDGLTVEIAENPLRAAASA
jgi:hypothetical protein